jgi:DNA-binding protein H-NS
MLLSNRKQDRVSLPVEMRRVVMPKRKSKTGTTIAQQPEKEPVQLSELTPLENIQVIEELLETFTAKELATVRDLAEKWRKRKVKDAKQAVLGEMKERLNALGLSLVDVIPSRRTIQKKTPALRIKYRSPDGETWSGRGHVPIWLRQLEQAGHNRDEYAVTAAIGSTIEK